MPPHLRPADRPLNLAPMRLILMLALVLGSAGLSRADEVKFVRVWPGWRDTASFERISEYFDGKENPGSQVLLRSHPEIRPGYYFLARVTNSGPALTSAKVVLSVITPDSPKTKAYTFPAALPAGDTVFNIGLTGADWVGEKIHPVAWKIEVVATEGHSLGAAKSFLWEKPDTTSDRPRVAARPAPAGPAGSRCRPGRRFPPQCSPRRSTAARLSVGAATTKSGPGFSAAMSPGSCSIPPAACAGPLPPSWLNPPARRSRFTSMSPATRVASPIPSRGAATPTWPPASPPSPVCAFCASRLAKRCWAFSAVPQSKSSRSSR